MLIRVGLLEYIKMEGGDTMLKAIDGGENWIDLVKDYALSRNVK